MAIFPRKASYPSEWLESTRLNILHECDCDTTPLNFLDEYRDDPICHLWSCGACPKKYPIGLIKHMPIRLICEPKDDFVLQWLEKDSQVDLRNFLLDLEIDMKAKFKYWIKGLFGLFKLHYHVDGDRGVVELSTKFTGVIEGVVLGEIISHVGKVSGTVSLKNVKAKVFQDLRKMVGESYDSYTLKMYNKTNSVLPSCSQLENL